MATDYVYKNTDDTKRFRILKRGVGWDYDTFTITGGYSNFSTDAGDVFRTKKDAKNDIEIINGTISSINPENVTSGW